MSRSSVGDFLRSAYELAAPPEAWLHGIAHAFESLFGAGLGAMAIHCDARDPSNVRTLGAASTLRMSGVESAVERTFKGLDREYILSGFRKMASTAASDNGLSQPGMVEYMNLVGARDMVGLIAADPSGEALVTFAHLPERHELTPDESAKLARLSMHVASAQRLRDETALHDEAAAFRPDGAVIGCANAPDETIARLGDAVRALARLQDRDHGRPLDDVTCRVDAEWTVLARFDDRGDELIVARRNVAPALMTPALDPLTIRERQIVSLLLLGRTQKMVAYELGVAHSTVRVLYSRALRKLGKEKLAALEQAFATKA